MTTPFMTTPFDKQYFEDGIKTGVSAYEDFRWIPERTLREASSITNNIQFNSVLDFGCAKGFMVYALRLLGKQAFGVDISEYAVTNCHPKVTDYVRVIRSLDEIHDRLIKYDLIIAKDVLEHIPKDEIPEILSVFRKAGKSLLIAVPLGDGTKYIIRSYEMDKTHIIRETEEWWLSNVISAGFKIKYFDYQFYHLKENWTVPHPYGNAFILAEAQ